MQLNCGKIIREQKLTGIRWFRFLRVSLLILVVFWLKYWTCSRVATESFFSIQIYFNQPQISQKRSKFSSTKAERHPQHFVFKTFYKFLFTGLLHECGVELSSGDNPLIFPLLRASISKCSDFSRSVWRRSSDVTCRHKIIQLQS